MYAPNIVVVNISPVAEGVRGLLSSKTHATDSVCLVGVLIKSCLTHWVGFVAT